MESIEAKENGTARAERPEPSALEPAYRLSIGTLFRNGAKILISGLGASGTAFLQGVIIARTLGPTAYGTWGIILAYCTMVKTFVGFRTTEPLTKYLVEFKASGDDVSLKALLQTALLTDLATNILSSILIVSLSGWVAATMGLEREASIAGCIFGAGVVFGFADSAFYSVMRNRKAFNILAALPLSVSVLQLGLIGLLAFLGSLTLTHLAIVFLGSAAFQSVLSAWLLRRRAKEDFGFDLAVLDPGMIRDRWGRFAGFWGFMRASYLSSMASSMLKNADVLLLGYFQPPAMVGLYRLAKNMATTIQSVGTSLSTVLYQDFNEIITLKREGALRDGIGRLMALWTPMVVLGVALAMLVAHPLIGAVYGAQFSPANPAFQVLVAGTGVAMALFWVQPLMLARGFYRGYLVIIVLCTASGLPAMAMLGKQLGATGMAAGYSITWALAHVFQLLFLVRNMTGPR